MQARLLRDVCGNPFRPATAVEQTWRTPTVLALARAISEDRHVGDTPVLADALEDAGCTDPVVLAHLRSPGPHVRGCWAVDLLTAGSEAGHE